MSGLPAGLIKDVPVIMITPEGKFIYNPLVVRSFSKLSKSQKRKVGAMWKELPRPPCEPDCVHCVDHYFYFIKVLDGPPVVVARAHEDSLPPMDENAVALVEMMKANSCEVEEQLIMEEEEKAAKEERRKQEKAAAKEEAFKLEREILA